jgi:hypothetical protein
MKKYYIVLTAFCAFASARAQGPTNVSPAVGGGNVQIASEKAKAEVIAYPSGTPGKVSNRGNVDYSAHIRIGSSYYDLQTNYAMPHRIVLHADGSVSTAWTTSPNNQTNFPNRGTGFNFRNSSGVWGASDSTRVEASVRTGWPNIGLLSDGKEFVIGHEANQGGFYISKATSVGARPSNATIVLQETPYKPIWARSANNGDTIHMIYSYTDSAVPGESRAPLRKGIYAPMVYSRSLDGGSNWDIQHIMLPDYDSTLTNNGGADQYAIDCIGNTVVVANADLLQGVVLWKSTDFGTNWTRIIADTFKYAPYSAKKLMLDTPYSNDGSVDVILDESGNIHAFWGLGRVLDTDTTDESYSFYPGLQGLVYWNEITKTSAIIAAGGQFDRDGDGFNGLSQATYSSLTSGNVPSGLNTVARLGNTSALRQPSAAIDESGNIFCVFSIPIEGDISDLGAEFRDIGVVASEDGGANWSTPQNLTQVASREDDFACVVRRTNSFLHLMWQQDEFPGTNLQNNSASFGNHPAELNKIVYQAIPVSDILNGSIGMQWGLKTEEPNTGEVMVVTQNYPNPFTGTTNVVISLNRPGALDVEVRNTTGALVKSSRVEGLHRGNHVIEIDAAGLPSGIYTYSLTAGGSTVSKTMMVK